jgi:hypothetical protein
MEEPCMEVHTLTFEEPADCGYSAMAPWDGRLRERRGIGCRL